MNYELSAMSHQLHSILLTIDVEDWFQVENFKQYIPFPSWPSYELRVEKNTHRLLDLLDSQQSAVRGRRSVSTNSTSPDNVSDSFRQRRIALSHFHPRLPSPGTGGQEGTEKTKRSSQSCLPRRWEPSYWGKSCLRKSSPKATFFALGWIAERLPNLVREIHSRGHEVASHGYLHNLCNQQSHEELKKDLIDSKKLLEDIIGAPVFGYRAPSFAINNDILKIIEDCGYLYDSSYNSFAMHSRYGKVDLPQKNNKGIAFPISETSNSQPSNDNQLSAMSYELPSSSNDYQLSAMSHELYLHRRFYELPISNLKLGNHIFPWGGGGYFRLIPFPVFKMGVQSILRKQGTYLLYLHPWELDPEQPRVKDAPAFFKFRHYINLSKTHSKLLRLIRSFQHCHFVTCSQYLSTISYEP